MKKISQMMCLGLTPGIALAHEGIDPQSIVHTIAHLGESYGLIVAVAVAVAIVVLLKRRRATVKSDRVD